ncbi:insulinase family protein [Algoriphagus sp. SE2]|uniref:M16 family metallopeptidase n=1 Tax=Algoriphagus sp. SE2 TaxID=3141536 RepID=UPI0031CD820E
MELDRSKAPEFRIPEDFELVSPFETTLKNGAKVFFNNTPNLEVVKIEVIGKGRKASLPLSQNLVPSFTLSLLQEGLKNRTGEKIAEFFDFHASEVNPILTFSNEGLALLTTKKHLFQVLPIFVELFTEASFPFDAIEKRKSQKRLGQKLEKEKTSSRAGQLFRKSLFGPFHPYGVEPEESHVNEINQDRLNFYYREMLWQNIEIFVSANLSDFEFQLLEKSLSSLPNRIESEQILIPEITTNYNLIEPRENSMQSSIRMGSFSIPKSHPDFIGLTVLNTILGGYFGSRLIKNIREDKGHTYGIFSSLAEIGNSEYWVISADVQKVYYKEVINEIYQEINKLVHEPISSEELEVVRNYMIGQMLNRFSSSFDLMDRFRAVHHSGLDLSYYFNKLSYLKSFQATDLLKLSETYYKDKSLVEVVVG